MRSFFIILSLVSFFFGRAQGGEQFRTSTATILGFENDTVFKASCKKVIIILNTSNEELQIEIFQESIKDDQPRVNNIFKEMDGNIKFFSKIVAVDVLNCSPPCALPKKKETKLKMIKKLLIS